MEYKVSVIVPVYGVEKYLRKCLDSLVMQTCKEMEIIVVNDSSPDNCAEIIAEYEEKYPNVRGLFKENGGLSSARNYGLEFAKGEYIGFIDSDDYAELDMYEKMLKKAEEDNCDLVLSDLIYTFEDGSEEDFVMKGMSDLNADPKKAAFLSPLFAWNKLYKREKYLSRMRAFYDADDIIKVITGVRRCGKSCLMATIAEELKNRGIPEENIIYLDLDKRGFRKIRTPDQLVYPLIINWTF